MNIKGWEIKQESTMIHGQVSTQILVVTHDHIANAKALLTYLEAYDPASTDPSDVGECAELRRAKEENEKLHTYFRGFTPEQIVEECNELYAKQSKPHYEQSIVDRKRFVVGLDILRKYNIYWTPPKEEDE